MQNQSVWSFFNAMRTILFSINFGNHIVKTSMFIALVTVAAMGALAVLTSGLSLAAIFIIGALVAAYIVPCTGLATGYLLSKFRPLIPQQREGQQVINDAPPQQVAAQENQVPDLSENGVQSTAQDSYHITDRQKNIWLGIVVCSTLLLGIIGFIPGGLFMSLAVVTPVVAVITWLGEKQAVNILESSQTMLVNTAGDQQVIRPISLPSLSAIADYCRPTIQELFSQVCNFFVNNAVRSVAQQPILQQEMQQQITPPPQQP